MAIPTCSVPHDGVRFTTSSEELQVLFLHRGIQPAPRDGPRGQLQLLRSTGLQSQHAGGLAIDHNLLVDDSTGLILDAHAHRLADRHGLRALHALCRERKTLDQQAGTSVP